MGFSPSQPEKASHPGQHVAVAAILAVYGALAAFWYAFAPPGPDGGVGPAMAGGWALLAAALVLTLLAQQGWLRPRGAPESGVARIDDLRDLVFLVGEDGTLRTANANGRAVVAQLFGDSFEGTFIHLFAAQDRPRVEHALGGARKGRTSRFMAPLDDRSGEPRVYHCEILPYGTEAAPACLVVARDLTTLWETLDALQESEERLSGIMNTVVDAIVVADQNGIICSFNQAAERMFGYVAEKVIGENISILMPEPESSRHQAYVDRYLSNGRPKVLGIGREFMARAHDGTEFPVEIALSEMRHGNNHLFTAIIRDITERKQAEARLRVAAKVLDATSEGVVVTDEAGRITWVNTGFSRISGYDPEEVTGTALGSVKPGLQRYGEGHVWQTVDTSGKWNGEVWNRRKSGETYPEWLTLQPVHDDNGAIIEYVGVFSDLSKDKQAEETIRTLTYYDAVTRLPNFHLFQDRLLNAMERAERNDRKVAVALIGLDRFKQVNESLGHQVGDSVLVEVAKRLKQVVRSPDVVGRLSGDIFCCLLTDLRDAHNAARILDKLVEKFGQSFMVENTEIFLTASLGVSIFPDDAQDVDGLLHQAETAMARSKDDTDSSYQFYMPEMNANSMERLRLETDLRKAVRRDELVLHYQPKVDIHTGRLLGAEALVRWEHPEVGRVSPGRFIPIAEETGLIASIGEWVLKAACEQIRDWRAAGHDVPCIAVNLSAQQFKQADLVDTVLSTLESYETPPELLEVELTETAVMENAETTISILAQLHERGLHIAVDDFGTGYSSLSYLKRFPLDRLKIDRSFVQDLGASPAGAEIVSAIVGMAHSLNLAVVAEGVENHTQLNLLGELNCDEVQGFYFGRPVPAPEFLEMIKQGRLEGEDVA